MKTGRTVFVFAIIMLVMSMAPVAGSARGHASAEDPHMRNALTNLQTAQNELRAAEGDKGGHRAKALEFVSQALTETQMGIDDRTDHVVLESRAKSFGAQPHMRAALDALNVARSELRLATANKGGHRMNAIKLTNEAVSETKIGIAYAKQ